uniref:Omega-3 fatty acid desaturase n=1 Tax=Plectospira myriandra TaxID=100863 RepID=A0A7R7EDH2_9STRA|nr:omega-3 fatty acid desaturase [Plectospira myriandra]
MVSSTKGEKPVEFPTLTEIKHSIPNTCFESDAATSLYYVGRSGLLTALFMTTLSYGRAALAEYFILDVLLCATYIYLQGVVFWGLFTIGHDCGHSSFSRYHSLNFIVGCITHSAILTPFESWRITHRHHHKNTGNIDKDEVFYPQREQDAYTLTRQMVYSLGFAWFTYLKVGYVPRQMDHFNPWDPLLVRRAGAVIISLFCWLAMVLGLAYLTYTLGVATMALYYFAPLFVFATFLVITTFLHHNDEDTPWYGDSEWTYVKGNLSSVDRSYGWLVDELSHNIGTHQIHHLFPIIPHYKLNEATAHFRKAFPEFVRKNDEPILASFWKTIQLFVNHGVVPQDAQIFSLGESAKKTL